LTNGVNTQLSDVPRVSYFLGISIKTLKDSVAFRYVHVDEIAGTVAWLSGQDVSPALLYEQSRPLNG